MKIAHIPKADYRIGQKLTVLSLPVVVVAYSHTGRNIIVHTLEGAAKFERIVCLCSDAEPIPAKELT